MKRVVDQTKKAEVDVSEVKCFKYYGAIVCGFSAFITREKYNSGYYSLRAFDGLTKGSGWDEYDNQNLQEMVSGLIKNGEVIYEFDTHQELLEWLFYEQNGKD